MSHDPEDWCKIWRKTDLLFQINMRNLTNFDLSTRNLKSFHFNGLLLSNAYIVWAKKSKEELFFKTLKSDTKFEEKLIWGLEMTWRIWQIFTRALKSVKIGTLMGSFCPK